MAITRHGIGKRMSEIVIHNDTIYLAGQVGEETSTTVAEQTREILASIDEQLGRAGSDKSKLLSATIYLSNMGTFNEMNAVWDAWVASGHTPARATVEARLAGPKYLVEISIIAAR